MKKAIITFLLLFWGCSAVGFVTVPYVIPNQNFESQQTTPTGNGQEIEVNNLNWWESFTQTLSVDSSYFYENYQNTRSGENAIGFHLRPVWQWERFKGCFDFAFYQNPWDDNHWQWGIPQMGVIPNIPNFMDSLAYQGDRLKISYQKIGDIDFGYGLLVNEYHPTNPYHGWSVEFTPTDTTKIIFVSAQEIIYLAPFESNDYASLQVLRLEQSLNTGRLQWQLGFTGVHDGYPQPDQNQFPVGGTEYDLKLTNLIWCSPFWETADLDHLGGANMLGVKGKLGLVSYQSGLFQTHGKFSPNYFGGNYEDLKVNSRTNSEQPGLPIINSDDDDSRDGLINRLWVEVSPWLSFGYLNIADVQNTTGYSLAGKIERLGVEYGFFYYNQLRDFSNYDWFIRGGNGFVGYEYHYYYDWNRNSHNNFEVRLKF